MTRALAFVPFAILALAVPRPSEAASARVALPVMGTVLEVTVVADDDAVAQRLARDALALAREWDDLLTTWRPDGALERLNKSAGEGSIPVDPRLAGALVRMLELSRATGGAFDPAVGAAVEAHRGGEPTAAASGVHGGITERLKVNAASAELVTGTRLDAGGIGKGMALDAIAELLAVGGARAWFLDFGGSSQLAHGSPKEGASWTIAIAGHSPGVVHGFVDLRSGSLSTSRARDASDASGAVVDPRSGRTIAPPLLVSVIARDATTADAWSTALVVLGRAGLTAAKAAGLAVLIDDADGQVMTAGFPLRASHGSIRPPQSAQ
jgi:thiamine biosynthesis lipoprotein